ncbi:MAG: hypothetical protein JG781_147 [Peptococcaceae bacterium]|jgi:histidinol phosphatase-like enzyme|nr:hypothetical protein [Peptococcaceae bacterium]
MNRAVFFSGPGTAYAYTVKEGSEQALEVYPETLPALRFLRRRGFCLVLITSDRQEFKNFLTCFKDKTIELSHWNGEMEELNRLLSEKDIELKESCLITDGPYLKLLESMGCRILLVLTGKGVCTLNSLDLSEGPGVTDICKNIYSAAFSVALNRKALTEV